MNNKDSRSVAYIKMMYMTPDNNVKRTINGHTTTYCISGHNIEMHISKNTRFKWLGRTRYSVKKIRDKTPTHVFYAPECRTQEFAKNIFKIIESYCNTSHPNSMPASEKAKILSAVNNANMGIVSERRTDAGNDYVHQYTMTHPGLKISVRREYEHCILTSLYHATITQVDNTRHMPAEYKTNVANRADGEFAREIYDLMHDLYRGQHVK